MPVEFDVPRNGYYFTRSVPQFPRVPLTEKEIVGLFVAQKTIAQYQGTSLQPVLDSAFRKMTAQLDDSVQTRCFPFGCWRRGTRSWRRLRC